MEKSFPFVGKSAKNFSIHVASRTKCNKFQGEGLRRCSIPQALPGTVVYLLHIRLKLPGCQSRQICLLWHKLTQQPICIFIESSLPCAMRMGKVYSKVLLLYLLLVRFYRIRRDLGTLLHFTLETTSLENFGHFFHSVENVEARRHVARPQKKTARVYAPFVPEAGIIFYGPLFWRASFLSAAAMRRCGTCWIPARCHVAGSSRPRRGWCPSY